MGDVVEGWEPRPGAVVLVEPHGAGTSPITAITIDDADGRVVLDVGASPTPADVEFDVVASVFAADRLFRITGALRLVEPDQAGRYELVAKEVERIERRGNVRRAIEVPITLTAFDGPGEVVSTRGHTVDLSSGGCRVVTDEPFPIESAPTVTLRLEGATVRAVAAIVDCTRSPSGFAYRLMFTEIDLDDQVRIAEAVVA